MKSNSKRSVSENRVPKYNPGTISVSPEPGDPMSAVAAGAARHAFSRFAFFSLLLGAAIIGFSGIFVRMSPVGPVATGFYRMILASPVFWAMVFTLPAARGGGMGERRLRWAVVLPGICFGFDTALWNWSLHLTTVSNATLFANLAPIFVTIGAWLLFREHISRLFLLGLATAIGGTFVLMSGSLEVSASHLLGDVFGCVTAIFYGGYQLSINRLRRHYSTVFLMACTCLVAGGVLLAVTLATGERLTWTHVGLWAGLAPLLGLAYICHSCGQGLIVFAMQKLPAPFSSVSLLMQPVVATIAAWAILAEAIGPLQMTGAAIVLLGILLAQRGSLASRGGRNYGGAA